MSDNWRNDWDPTADPALDDDFRAESAAALAHQPTFSPFSYPVSGHGEGAEVGLFSVLTVTPSHPLPPQDPITSRFPCSYPACTKDFKRSSDRFRHIASIHQRGQTTQGTILCPIAGCRRSYGRGLSRPDKLREHLQKIHNIVRSPQSQARGTFGVSGNANAGQARWMGPANMTEGLDAIASIANFGTTSTSHNDLVQGGTIAGYSYEMNTAGMAENFGAANTAGIASNFSVDQLQGNVDVGIAGDFGAFGVANFDIGQAQDVTNVGMADATNIFGTTDVSQLPSGVNAGSNPSLADLEWVTDLAAGLPAGSPADWETGFFDDENSVGAYLFEKDSEEDGRRMF
ncbi:hypothetical protein ACMFMG_002330 [Clarireedia jacksonii]